MSPRRFRSQLPALRFVSALAVLVATLSVADARPAAGLGEKVAFAEPDITLAALLDRLTRATGVTHRYTAEAKYEHLALFCTDRTASDIHQAIKSLILWEFRVRGQGAGRVCSFFPSLRLRKESSAGLALDESNYRRYLEASFRIAAMDPSSEEWAAFKKERPTEAGWLSNPQSRLLLGNLRSLGPDRLKDMLNGRKMSFSFATMPSALREGFEGAFAAGGMTKHGPFRRVTMSFQRDGAGLPEMWDAAYEFAGVQGKVHLYVGQASVLDLLGEPGEGESDRAMRARTARLRQDPLLSQPVPAAKPPLDPERQPPEFTNATLWMFDLHRRIHIPLLADVYPHREGPARGNLSLLQMTGRPVWNVLDTIRDDGGWRLEEGWVLVRDPSWYRGRAMEKRFHTGPRPTAKPDSVVQSCCSDTDLPVTR